VVIKSEGSIMSAILNLLYREYCRARLAEMRKQLLLKAADDGSQATDWDASDPAGPDDRENGPKDDTETKKPQPSRNRIL
jgi:hypothetical protein